ncbi:hypothetical protein ACTJKJ_26770 [Roseateles sp. 22389]|uniref:hypothetical protein n=1 Tax=Roseateles sp. 22389 TaxID=3453916 RepID=UPI003F863968
MVLKLRAFVSAADSFLRNHWIGIISMAVATGVLGNFAYDAVKPKDSPTGSVAPPFAEPQPLDWHSASQAMRASATSMRTIVGDYVSSSPPKKWKDAEAEYKRASDHYAASDFQAAYESFKRAHALYQDLFIDVEASRR